MRKQPSRLSLIERALIEKKWHATTVDAEILALIGDDSSRMVNAAGRVLYVVLGSAIAEDVDPEMVEFRIIRGAVNAVHDQAGEPEIPPARRQSIVRGLEACRDLIPLLERRTLVAAACELETKLKRQDVSLADFAALFKHPAKEAA